MTLLTATFASDLIAEAERLLDQAGVESARGDARQLLLAAAGISRVALVSNPQTVIADEHRVTFRDMVSRRIRREPVTRIIGMRAFWKSDFEVTPAVLDPRPETECLIESALTRFKERKDETLRILDLGTGSGAIICSLLLEFPNATGVACDLSDQALEVARHNAARIGVLDRLSLVHRSWSDVERRQRDIIVSNPPYIESTVIPRLEPEVADYDPPLALDGGPDGLDCYREIAPLIRSDLAPGGWAFIEIGYKQASLASRIFHNSGLKVARVVKDNAGLDRALEMETL